MAIAILKKGLPGKNVEKLDAMREVSEVVHDLVQLGYYSKIILRIVKGIGL